MEQLSAPECRSTLVTPSRSAHASTAPASSGRSALSASMVAAMPAASRASRAPSSSSGRVGARIASTACRTSSRAVRPTRSMSAACSAAASGSVATSRRTAWALTTITDRVCPSRSCRSRENRSRSSATATRASSARVRRSSATVSSSRVNAVLASRVSSTTKASVHTREPSCGSTRHAAQPDIHSTTAPASASQRPRSTTGAALATRIHVPSHWTLACVAPAKQAASMVLNAR